MLPDARETVMAAVASECGFCSYATADTVIDALVDNGYLIAEDSFMGLVKVAQQMLDYHYPTNVFTGASLDSGAQFVAKLRGALSMVHADTDASTAKDAR